MASRPVGAPVTPVHQGRAGVPRNSWGVGCLLTPSPVAPGPFATSGPCRRQAGVPHLGAKETTALVQASGLSGLPRQRLTVPWWEGLQDAPPPALSAILGPPSLST